MRVLLDEEHGGPGRADLADHAEDLLDQDRCEAKGWLVEHKQAWPGHEGPSDGEHLLLAAAQRSGALLQPLAEAREIFEHARRLLACRTEMPSRVAAEQQILAHGQIREYPSSFGHLDDPRPHHPVWAPSIDTLAIEVDRAARGPEETGNHPQCRRLARAVRPEQRDDAPLSDLETDAVQGADAPVVGLDLVHREQRTSRTRHRRPRVQVRRGRPR